MKTHLDTVSSFIVGLIFGIGLIFAGMTDPSKVIGFLDISGVWDPSLAFVMAGAILVGLVAFRFANHRTMNFLGGAIRLPTKTISTHVWSLVACYLAQAGAWRAFARAPHW